GSAFAPPFRGSDHRSYQQKKYRRELRAFCAPLLAASRLCPNMEIRSALFSADRPSRLWGPFRFPGSVASSAIGYATASWEDLFLKKADQESLSRSAFRSLYSSNLRSPAVDEQLDPGDEA